ncbi:TPA: hypothetical protein ACPUUO_004772 [Klebsiella pneumoniae]
MTSREQFEQKIQHEYGDDYLAVNEDGDYINWITSDLWECWAASRAAIELNLTSEWDISSDGSRHYDADSVDEQLLALGIKVKK